MARASRSTHADGAPDPHRDDARRYREAIGRRLRELRLARGWSQEAFADEAGLHRAYMGFLENGKRNFPVDTLFRLARTLGLSPTDLLPSLEKEEASVEGERVTDAGKATGKESA